MVKFDSKSAQIDEKEVTAYIQQQMVELKAHLEEKDSVQVRITQVGSEFEAEVTAYQEEGEIQTIGRHPSPFDAIKHAKEGLIEYFVEVEEELNPQMREEKINHLSRNGNLYLH